MSLSLTNRKRRKAKLENLPAQIETLQANTKLLEMNKPKVPGIQEIYTMVLGSYEEHGYKPVRDISTFNRTFKTSDIDKITIGVASHVWGKYKVPAYLTNSWVNLMGSMNRYTINTARFAQVANSSSGAEYAVYRSWYVCAASGGSLYKAHTKEYFTKNENHAFLNCPIKNASV